jgi:Cu-processing system permease protein
MKTESLSIGNQELAPLVDVAGHSNEKSVPGRQAVSFLRQIRLIAARDFGDRFRSGWVIACGLVWLGAIGLTSFLGLIQIGNIGIQGYERTVISMLNLVQYLVPLLGLLLGHDLIVSEKEDRTLRLLVAGGVSRMRVLVGKFLGGCLSLTVPLLLGFMVSGVVIGLAARDTGIAPFVRLAWSGLGLGLVFLGMGLLISVFARTKVQALVVALLAWCLFVFVFDLAALGILVSAKAPAAGREIELACDATHINTAADVHAVFDSGAMGETEHRPAATVAGTSIKWLAVNPIDIFRAINLPSQFAVHAPWFVIIGCFAGWLLSTLAAGFWKLRGIDL